tara:strand:- start:860 stop:1372 length:513 start_codon:yes stop_codon:yes gene_type:complete
MADSYFAGTVIFICAHSHSAGTIGFILNKPVEESASQLIESWLERASGPRMVFTGGPVDSEDVVGVVKRTEQSALNPAFIHLTPDVDAVDLDDLSAGDLNTGTPFRIFAGFSGWSPGQLEAEIHSEGWMIAPGSIEDIFDDDPSQLFGKVLRRQPGGLTEYYPVAALDMN